jgi:hypothetical protein
MHVQPISEPYKEVGKAEADPAMPGIDRTQQHKKQMHIFNLNLLYYWAKP